MGVCARDVRGFDATPPLLRRVIGDCARQTTVRRMQGEHLERAESRKVTDCAISVLFHFSYGYGRRYRRVVFSSGTSELSFSDLVTDGRSARREKRSAHSGPA